MLQRIVDADEDALEALNGVKVRRRRVLLARKAAVPDERGYHAEEAERRP